MHDLWYAMHAMIKAVLSRDQRLAAGRHGRLTRGQLPQGLAHPAPPRADGATRGRSPENVYLVITLIDVFQLDVLYIYIYIYILEREIDIYIYIERERDRYREREIEIHTDRSISLAGHQTCPPTALRQAPARTAGHPAPEVGLSHMRLCMQFRGAATSYRRFIPLGNASKHGTLYHIVTYHDIPTIHTAPYHTMPRHATPLHTRCNVNEAAKIPYGTMTYRSTAWRKTARHDIVRCDMVHSEPKIRPQTPQKSKALYPVLACGHNLTC